VVSEADEAARRDRALARATRVGADAPLTPSERMSLAAELSRIAWTLSGKPWPSYKRATIPVRVIARVDR
jgi:hypothetical protein